MRRLGLVGQVLDLKGKGMDGADVDTAKLTGKTYAVVFWSSSIDASRLGMPEIAKLQAKHKAKGFEVISIALDSDAAKLGEYLKENPLPFPTIFEPNGLDGRLAVEFGIMSMPTMFLVDAQGKVLFRAVRSPADLDVKLEKILGAAGGGVALGGNKP